METAPHFYLDVPRPARLSRLLIFVKWLLIMPHAFILYFFGLVAGLATLAAWWAILFTGRYPQGLWEFNYAFQRWTTRCTIYSSLLRDEYPPFGEAPYPMEFHVQRPAHSSRLLLFGRFFLSIPLAFWSALLGLVYVFASLVAFFAILFTGSIPESTRQFMIGVIRYSTRINCWGMMLFDTWPGFSTENPTS